MIASLKSALPPWLASARAEDLLSFTLWLVVVCGLGWLVAQAMDIGGAWSDSELDEEYRDGQR